MDPYGSDNALHSMVLIFQLSAQAYSLPVSSVNLNQIAWFESGGGYMVVTLGHPVNIGVTVISN